MPPGPIVVGVLSPHELVLTGLTAMLRRHPSRVKVCSGDPLSPDVQDLDAVLYDAARIDPLGTPAGSDLEQLVRTGTRVVALARPHEPALTAAALERGAVGVVRMEASATEMLDVLDRVASTGARAARSTRHVDARLLRLPHGLTVREFEVLGLVAAGLSNAEIAARLYVSINTVKTYVRAAYRKIGVERRSQAVIWCSHHGVAAV